MAAGVALWLGLQYKPAWYRHVLGERSAPKRARAEAVRLADTLSDSLVAGRTVEMVLSDRVVTGWLAALPSVMPNADYQLPSGVTEPVVCFDSDGIIRVGARVDQSGMRSILNVGVRVELVEESRYIRVALVYAKGGALQAPRAVMERILKPLFNPRLTSYGQVRGSFSQEAGTLPQVHSVDNLFDGVRMANRFVWPNGDRAFKIDGLRHEDGLLKIQITPIRKGVH